MSNWKKNRELARTRNTKPTLTDQSSARDTDINIIVKQYTVHGQLPGNPGQPMHEDFTGLPTDLRGFIEQARSLKTHTRNLPEALRELTTEQLLSLTPQELAAKLAPPDKPADTPPTEEPK